MNDYQTNPLLEESKGLLKFWPEKARNGLAKYLRDIRKGSVAKDPVMVAVGYNPVIPGSMIIGNSYTKAIPGTTRARAYKLALDNPIKAAAKGITGIPKAVGKTAMNIPSATMSSAENMSNKALEIGLKHGIDFNQLAAMIPIR